MAKIRQLKIDEPELTYLSINDIDTLLCDLDTVAYRDAHVIARVCLATGARWTKAETLTGEQVKYARITFGTTKSGKLRTVSINGCILRLLQGKKVRLFQYSYDDFRRAIRNCVLDIPAEQSTHILRHAFASHIMMNGSNILTLQKYLAILRLR